MNYLPRSLGSVDVWFLAYLVVILFGVGILLTVEWIMDARRYLDEAQKSSADLLARTDDVGDGGVRRHQRRKSLSVWVK